MNKEDYNCRKCKDNGWYLYYWYFLDALARITCKCSAGKKFRKKNVLFR